MVYTVKQIVIKNNMSKKQILVKHNLDPELWNNDSIDMIQKWIAWFRS